MKIGILTQPLHTNYGGLLQAFALQKYLRDELGHEVLTVDYTRKPKAWLAPYRLARRCVAKFLLGRKISLFPKPLPQGAGKFTQRFIDENIRTTKKIFAPARECDFAEYGFEAFVVGSDQTWRPAYSPHIPTFFLDFLGTDEKTCRVAYASSFGKDEWEFTPEMTTICAPLAKRFHAISVREDSGVSLCEKYLGVKAEHVIDPTMLLSKEDYCAIVERDETRGVLEKRISEKRLFAYVLDEAPEKKTLINLVAGTLDLVADEIMPTREELRFGTKSYPPVSAWLRGFRDAEFVVTDSFHGCVFSIIFNKPFVAIGNASRGMSRFNSLLKMFGLGNRLLFLSENSDVRERISNLLSEKIDWEKINAIRSQEQARSRQFLEKALPPNSPICAENIPQNDLRSSVSSAGTSSPKISVIVPVYKVEKYLPECIESVLAQTFTDFELILVDDGSPDNSGKICDDYAKKDPRIRVFHKENGGVTSARRLGVECSQAEWILLLDGDDWLDSQCLEKMRERADEAKADYIVGDFYIDDDCGNTIREQIFEDFDVATQEEFLIYRFSTGDFYVTGRLFRKSALRGVFEELPEYITFGEDNVMQCLMAFNINYFAKLNFKILHYIQRPGSVCNSMHRKTLQTRADAVDFVSRLILERCHVDGALRGAFFSWLAREVRALAKYGIRIKSNAILSKNLEYVYCERKRDVLLTRMLAWCYSLCLFVFPMIFFCKWNVKRMGLKIFTGCGKKKRTQNVLVLSSGTIGDTIVVTPFFPVIRKAFPDAKVFLHSSFGFGEIVRELVAPMGCVDEFILESSPSGNFVQRLWKRVKFALWCRKKKIDVAVSLLRFFQYKDDICRRSARRLFFTLRLGGIKQIFGLNYVRGKELLGNKRVVEAILETLIKDGFPGLKKDSILQYSFNFSEEEMRIGKVAWEKLGVPNGYVPVAVCCGGKQSACWWPHSSWRQLSEKLFLKGKLFPVFFGGEGDREKSKDLICSAQRGVFVPEACRGISLRESILIMRRCAFYLGHDTGSLHMATVAGLRCVAIFSAHNSTELWFPWGDGHIVLRRGGIPCEGCDKPQCPRYDSAKCIAAVSVDEVFSAVDRMCKFLGISREG